METLLRVNMTERRCSWEHSPAEYDYLGGRSLSARILLQEVDPLCEPLGEKNKLILCPGLLGGLNLSSAHRLSVGGKSPLTGGIKEANSGGTTALRLAQAGIKGVIIEGKAEKDSLMTLYLEVDAKGERRASLVDTPELKMLTTSDTLTRLWELFGHNIAAAIIGPAGEMKLAASGVANLDLDGRPTRFAARGGLGAVMGSKGLKAVVIQSDHLSYRKAQDEDLWKRSRKTFVEELKTNPATAEIFPLYGTAATLEKVNALGGLPTHNFQQGQFRDADKISGHFMYDMIKERNGEGTTTHACMPGCMIRCSNSFPDKGGKFLAAPMEYETNALLGSNLGVNDFDAIAQMTHLCGEIGVDTIEVGVAMGMAMETGLLKPNDGEGAIRLIQEIGEGTYLGRIFGSGAVVTGKVLGIERIPAVRGQGIPAYDPRGIKGNGVTYATSPMGADHTAGNTIAVDTDHLDPKGKVEISKKLQIQCALIDGLGFCNFVRGVMIGKPEVILNLFNGAFKTRFTQEELSAVALRTIQDEVLFNKKAGQKETVSLAEFFYQEKLPPHDVIFDVPEEELASIWND